MQIFLNYLRERLVNKALDKLTELIGRLFIQPIKIDVKSAIVYLKCWNEQTAMLVHLVIANTGDHDKEVIMKAPKSVYLKPKCSGEWLEFEVEEPYLKPSQVSVRKKGVVTVS